MDPPSDHHLDNLLEGHGFQHNLLLGGSHHLPEPTQQHQPPTRKKGRPKGLKTNKEKTELKNEKNGSNKNSGHWLHEQKKRYHWFLEIHSKHFIVKKLRRMDKIFKIMAEFIGTREAEQCRSHHQKMERKYHSFYKILKHLRQENYMSADSIHVKIDLENHQIFEYDPLIPEETLDNEKIQSDGQEENEEGEKNLEIEGGAGQQDHCFFMGDHYEENLHYKGH